MKKLDKKNIKTIIISVVLLVLVVSVAFAYIGKFIVDISNKANVNIAAKNLANSILDVTNADFALTIDPKGMSQSNRDNYVAENTSSLVVSLISGSEDYSVSCTYDITFTYDSDSSIYGKSPTPVTSGATKELTLEAKGPNTGTNNYAEEKNFNLTTTTATIVSGAVIANSSSSKDKKQTWNFTNRFYNLDLDQSALANKTFKGKYKVTNAKCTMGDPLPPEKDITVNVETPAYLLSGYTKSITNCTGTNSAVWDNKLNGLVISNWSDLVNCDITFTQKTPSSSELLSTIVTNNAQNKNDTTIVPATYGYRYQGADPDNYIWYNDELWRIIGYVPVSVNSATETGEYRVKIIRNDSIGALVRETNTSSTTVWEDKSLYTLLNTCYLGKASSCTSACYSYYNSSYKPVTQCNYSVNGIDESEYYGNMVENVYWGIGTSAISTATTMYGTENSTKTSKQAKIGLMSASDWGLAISGYTGSLSYSSAQGYTKDNYLFTNGYEWTMTSTSSGPLRVNYRGGLDSNNSYNGIAARPVLYLKSNVYVTGGTGSKTDPYTLGI